MSSDFSPELRQELLDDFYTEADEHLGHIRAQLTSLEKSIGRGVPDATALESLYRNTHSFKGISAMVGLGPAEQLAHAAEGYLRQLTRGETQPSAEGFELLVTIVQRFEQIVTAHRLKQPIPDVGDLMSELRALAVTAPAAAPAAPPSAAEAPSTTPNAVQGLLARGLAPWQCTFAPSRELDARGININAVRARLNAVGEIGSAVPTVRPGGSIAFEFIFGLRGDPPDFSTWAADGLDVHPCETAETAPAESANAGASSTGLFIAPSHLVRVDLSRLDDLMRIAGEMVIQRSRLEERINQSAGDQSALREVNVGLGRSLRQLRAAITRLRLVPVAEIFTRMPFVVRDLGRESGKQATLVLEGQHTEIDKYLVERLKEPLLHLVRNAFTHGIEFPEERTAAGKPAVGTIVLRASTAGEFAVIQIRDDGRGIDRSVIAARATALGIAVPEVLDDTALLRLLCTPGFSTREEADRAAGRGVGMAVVYETVHELGGTMSLDSAPGRGAQFTIRLPLTLSIAETIIVSAAGQTCAVPQGFIDEILQVNPSDVRTIQQAEVIPYRDGVLPIVRLSAMFGARPAAPSQLSVLVLSSERGSTGLVVDRVHTQREVVVRPMRDPLVKVPGISGATELGDGRAVLILDPMALTNRVVRPLAPADRHAAHSFRS